METNKSIVKKIRTIRTQELYVMYIVNLKDDYKKHLVFYELNSAKHMKKHIISRFYLGGKEVYVNKVLGFYDNANSIHCLNGFKYTLSSIERNEKDYKNNDIETLLLRLESK